MAAEAPPLRSRGSVRLAALALVSACLWTLQGTRAVAFDGADGSCTLADGVCVLGEGALTPSRGWGGARRRSGEAAAPGAAALPNSSLQLLRVPLCAAADALGASAARPVAALAASAARACAELSPPPEQVFEDFGPGVAAWRAEAMGTFWRTSAAVAALVIPLGRFVLDKGFQALGRRWLPGPCDDSDFVFLKWREASWKLLTYGFLTVFGICSCAGEPWLTDTSLLWRGWPYAQAHSAPLRFWYAAEFGLYAYGLVDLLVWEAARGDYYAMILHHVSTLGLLGGSFAYGFLRIGAIVMMINDFVDLWFEGAKLAKYAAHEHISTAFYLGFVASWAVLRQVYAPLAVCRSTLQEAWSLVAIYGPTPRHVAIWAGFNALVLVLQVLHTYWFIFLLQKIKVNVVINVSIKVVDRRPGCEVAELARTGSTGECCAAASPRLKARVAPTLLEDD